MIDRRKLSNNYQRAFGRLYAKTPKAVFAAVALSYANWACGTEAKDDAEAIGRFLAEWRALYDNQIVQQKPPREALDLTPERLSVFTEDLGDAGRTYDADGKVATDWNEKEQMELENKLFEESAQ